MKKKISICAIALITAFITAIAFMPSPAYAQTAKQTKMYEVYKVKNTVYCCGDTGLYKLKVKSGKVVSKTRLVKADQYSPIFQLHKKGKYIYYLAGTSGTTSYICRVKIKTKKRQTLANLGDYGNGFSIDGKWIYYAKSNPKFDESEFDYDYLSEEELIAQSQIKMRMRLNGNDKQRTGVSCDPKYKRSNKDGYKVVRRYKEDCCKEYLKTPKGKFYLGKYRY